jgi:hypothetical protein
MKKWLILIILVMSRPVLAQQQDAISKFFSKYMEDEDFTSIYISGKMFGLIAKLPDGEDELAMKETLKNLAGLRILSSEKANGEQLYQEFSKNLNTKGYEELMFIREKGKPEMQIMIRENAEKIEELLMLSGSDSSFFMMSLIGSIDLEQISKLSKSMEIDGLENLEKLKDKPKNPKP